VRWRLPWLTRILLRVVMRKLRCKDALRPPVLMVENCTYGHMIGTLKSTRAMETGPAAAVV